MKQLTTKRHTKNSRSSNLVSISPCPNSKNISRLLRPKNNIQNKTHKKSIMSYSLLWAILLNLCALSLSFWKILISSILHPPVSWLSSMHTFFSIIAKFFFLHYSLLRLLYSPLGYRLTINLRPIIRKVKEKEQSFEFSESALRNLSEDKSIEGLEDDEDDKIAILTTMKTVFYIFESRN